MISLRQRNTVRPGHTRINWHHPIVKDLAYCRVFDNLSPHPLFSRSEQNAQLTNGAMFIQAGPRGQCGLTATSGNATATFYDTANSFLPATGGSIFASVVPFFDAGDGKTHHIWSITGANNSFSFLLDGSSIWQFGFYVNPTDYRVAVAGAGTFTSGYGQVVGGTWVINGSTVLWASAANIGNHASPTTMPDLGSASFRIAGNGTGTWGQDSKSMIRWLAIWDRVLSDGEIAWLSSNSNCFFASDYNPTASLLKFNPGVDLFRLRIGVDNTAGTQSGEFELFVKKNSGSYSAVTTSSTEGVISYDASSDADDTVIRVPRLTPFT